MGIDLNSLISHLEQAEEEDPRESWNMPDYVFDHIFWPLLCDKKVPLKELDYSRFDFDDLFLTAQAIESAWREGNAAEKIKEVFLNAAAACTKSRAFC